MSDALQVALILAAVAFIVLVAVLIPIAIRGGRQLGQLVLSADQLKDNLKANLDLLVHDSRAMVRSVEELSKRVNEEIDEVSQVVRTARQWTERADRLVNEVASVIEPPILSFVRNISGFRTGARAFLNAFFHSGHNGNGSIQEKAHV